MDVKDEDKDKDDDKELEKVVGRLANEIVSEVGEGTGGGDGTLGSNPSSLEVATISICLIPTYKTYVRGIDQIIEQYQGRIPSQFSIL